MTLWRRTAIALLSLLPSSALGCAHAPAATTVAASVTAQAPTELRYRLHANLDGASPSLDVQACFLMKTASLVLELPSAHWGEEGFAKTIVDLKATTPGATLAEPTSTSAKDSLRTLSAAPGSSACIAYRVVPGQGARTESEAHWPTLAKDHFYFFAFATLIMPSEGDTVPRRTVVTWDALPSNWTHGSSLGERGDAGEEVSTSVEDLIDTVFFAGDYRVTAIDIRGKPVRFATRGQWAKSDAELASSIRSIIGAERAFFHDDSAPTYLVVLSPYGHADNMGGEGLPNAFAAYASPEMATVKWLPSETSPNERLLLLLAHEMFHTWNGGHSYNTHPDGVLYWMSEGFTDYYARRILLQAGLIDFAAYVRTYDEDLAAYDTSPAKTFPNSRVVTDFWKDRDVEKLPYRRGEILAHRWNQEILAASGGHLSFDDAMRALTEDTKLHGPLENDARFLALMRTFLPAGVDQDVQTYIDDGAVIPRADGDAGSCAHQVPLEISRFVRGFSRSESEKSGKISGVVAGSNAERAGVKNGMVLKHLDPSNDPNTPTDLLVEDAGKLRHISYLPSGPPFAAQTYQAIPKGSQSPACFSSIGLSPR